MVQLVRYKLVLLTAACFLPAQIAAWGKHDPPTSATPAPSSKANSSKAKKAVDSEPVAVEPNRFKSLLQKALGPEIEMAQRELNKATEVLKHELDSAESEFRGELKGAQSTARKTIQDWKKALDPEVEALVKTWLNDDGLKSAYATYSHWQQVLQQPRLKRLIQDLGLSELVSRKATAVLTAQVPPQTLAIMHIALNVTAEVTADVLEAPEHRADSTRQIMHELTLWAEDVDSTLAALIETRAWVKLCPEAYRPAVSKLVKTRAIPRVLLTSCAALLHGFDTRKDPLLNALIVAFSLEQVTQSMALASLALLDQAFGNEDPEITGQNSGSNPDSAAQKRWMDGGLKGLLDASSDASVQPSCEEIAESAFSFFAELSSAVHKPATAAAPLSTATPTLGTQSSSSSSSGGGAIVPNSSNTGSAVADAELSDSSSSSSSSSGHHGGFRKRFHLHRRKSVPENVPMGHELVVQRCDHLSRSAKIVLNMVRLLRKQGASKRASKARKEAGAYQWGGMYTVFPTAKDAAKKRQKASSTDNSNSSSSSSSSSSSDKHDDSTAVEFDVLEAGRLAFEDNGLSLDDSHHDHSSSSSTANSEEIGNL